MVENAATGIVRADMELIFDSGFAFDKVTCKLEPDIPLSDAEKYNFSLYILDGEFYVKTDISVEYSGGYFEGQVWTFELTDVTPGKINFQIVGEMVGVAEFNYEPLIYSGIIAFIAFLGFAIAGQSVSKGRFKKFGKNTPYIYGAVAAGGAFVIAAILWYFVFGGTLLQYNALFAPSISG